MRNSYFEVLLINGSLPILSFSSFFLFLVSLPEVPVLLILPILFGLTAVP